MDNYVKVAVRIKPLTSSEKEEEAAVHWKTKASSYIYPVADPSNIYTFSHAFTEKDDNEVIYSKFCSPVVQSAVKGFNGAIIAYGQVSSGKTFTMMGDDDIKIEGIIHFSVYDLFKLIENNFDRIYFIRIACLEIHKGKISRDLLCDSNEFLPIQEKNDRINRPLLTRYTVQEPQDVFNFIKEAQKKRETKSTLKTENSSGSSLVIDLLIESGPMKVEEENEAELSHLLFLDPTENSDFQPNEIVSISNKRQKLLMQPKEVARYLANNKGKSQFIIPQDTPILEIYENILGGNFVTAIICTISPTNLHETYAYLEIATLARSIQNKPVSTRIISNNVQLVRYVNQLAQLIRKMQSDRLYIMGPVLYCTI
ncbi:unnamed protein product [Larinioides sclopetarius]|uniref:Kinesin motor domain-containing protein n=1 Tax=Larinioides sclopetarius TaxID=280406 RepID=A0AAV2B1H9_9ARAC